MLNGRGPFASTNTPSHQCAGMHESYVRCNSPNLRLMMFTVRAGSSLPTNSHCKERRRISRASLEDGVRKPLLPRPRPPQVAREAGQLTPRNALTYAWVLPPIVYGVRRRTLFLETRWPEDGTVRFADNDDQASRQGTSPTGATAEAAPRPIKHARWHL